MIRLNVIQTKIGISNHEPIVEGNINSIFLKFTFSPAWEQLARIAVFCNQGAKVSVSLTSDICAIPWEVINSPGELFISLRGIGDGGNYVLCTENESLGKIIPSHANRSTEASEAATPSVVDTLLADVAELKATGGATGKSAYQIAVDNGFVGSEEQWLSSLSGADGDDAYTPIRGTDYWTDADIAEIKRYVDAAILGGAW